MKKKSKLKIGLQKISENHLQLHGMKHKIECSLITTSNTQQSNTLSRPS